MLFFGLEAVYVLYGGIALFFAALFCSVVFRRVLRDTPMIPQVPPQHNLSPILLMSATELSRKLRAGELTSYQIVSAFVRHIRAVNPYINAIVYDRCELALEEAKEADKLLQKILRNNNTNNKDKSVVDPGWLLGIPCTIKESMQVVGCPNTSGHPHRKDVVSTVDSPVVKRLRDKGAIVLGVTNTSELCMWYESFNNVYGHSRNPYDVRCLVGGSSGGEGASIASMFAPFGLGADIGGSIRMPAFFNGVFGHKCSTRLVPNQGQHPGVKGSGNFLMATGPICRHAEDLLPLLRTMAEGGYLEDPNTYPPAPMPPSELLNLRTYTHKNGAVGSDSAFSPVSPNCPTGAFPTASIPDPATQSGVVTLDEAFNSSATYFTNNTNTGGGGGNGNRLVNFQRRLAAPIKVAKKLRVYVIEDLGLFGHGIAPSQLQCINECAQRLARDLHADVRVLNFRDASRCTGPIPRGWLKMRHALDMWSSLMSQPEHENTFSQLMSMDKPISPWLETLKWLAGRSEHTIPALGLMVIETIEDRFIPSSVRQSHRDMAAELIEAVEEELGDDGIIITPTFPSPAPRHHLPLYTSPLQFQYTALFNSLQMPTTAVPLWDPMSIGKRSPSPLDARRMHVRPECRIDFHLPRGVQVTAKWGNDILALSVAAELEKMFGGYKPPHWAHFARTPEAADAAVGGL